jgi:hypothetical protein
MRVTDVSPPADDGCESFSLDFGVEVARSPQFAAAI